MDTSTGHEDAAGGAASFAALLKQLPERAAQARTLHRLLSRVPGDTDPLPLLFVSGPPLSGKTTVVRGVTRSAGARALYVNCTEAGSGQDVVACLWQQLCKLTGAAAGRCTTVDELLWGAQASRRAGRSAACAHTRGRGGALEGQGARGAA